MYPLRRKSKKRTSNMRAPVNKSKPQLVKSKAIISGSVIELFEYKTGYLTNFEDKLGVSGRRKDYVSEDYEENREKTLRRARATLKRLINSNIGAYGKYVTPKFLTITFAENMQDMKKANYEFKKFMQRLNYHVCGEKKAFLKYSAVIEFQERGAIHYHIVLYNMKYIKAEIINKIWDHGCVGEKKGNINIKKIIHVDNVGNYLCKYMTKESENELLRGQKCYFNSRGLRKPKIIVDKKRVEAIRVALPLKHLKCHSIFESELGLTKYYQFNMKYINDAIPCDSYNLSNVRVNAPIYAT